MLFQLVCLVFFHTVLADRIPKPSYNMSDYEAISRHFEKFITDHNKQYDEHERAVRFQIFQNNLREINRLNEKHPMTLFDINKFSDITEEEMQMYFGFSSGGSSGSCQVMGDLSSRSAPAAWDWREQGVVSPVKNQGGCLSCWAFSTTGLLESRNLQAGRQVSLSEQQLMDCDKQSNSCDGGLMTYALTYVIQQGGLESEADYPYEARDDTCRFNSSKIATKVKSCRSYSLSGEEALKELLYTEGPLSIGVAAKTWSQYHSGIFRECGSRGANHAVLLVGYGSENGQDYWVIKNSWGAGWGDQGFIKIPRGNNCCDIGSDDPITKVSATIG